MTESGPVEDADAAIAAIYADLLTRDDLPVIDHFLIIRMTWADGTLRILGSQALQQALEGN